VTRPPAHAVSAPVQPAVDALPSAIHSIIQAFAPSIQSSFDPVAPGVQTPIHAVAFAFQAVGQPFPALFPGPLLPSLHVLFPTVASAVETILDPVAFFFQPLLAAIAVAVKALFDAIPAPVQAIAPGASAIVPVGPGDRGPSENSRY
jgi:hypothetical protein